jgi:HK97 family phage major capsid protein
MNILHTDYKDSTSATAGSTTASRLIPRTLFGTLIRAVRRKLVLRALAARIVTNFAGSSIDFALDLPEKLVVNRVAPGAEIPLSVEQYSGFNVRPAKYGCRIMIVKEVLEDGMWDSMDMNVETAGYALAKNEESLIVAQLDAADTASSQSVANSNATIPPSDITRAIQYLEAANHVATHFLCGVEIANDLRNLDIFTSAAESGINDPSKRLIGKIWEMKVIVSNSISSVLAYVIDADHAFMVVEKRPVTIEKYFDAARDAGFASVTQRLGVRYIQSTAVSEITTT